MSANNSNDLTKYIETPFNFTAINFAVFFLIIMIKFTNTKINKEVVKMFDKKVHAPFMTDMLSDDEIEMLHETEQAKKLKKKNRKFE